jgi:hypothetical protein
MAGHGAVLIAHLQHRRGGGKTRTLRCQLAEARRPVVKPSFGLLLFSDAQTAGTLTGSSQNQKYRSAISSGLE